MTTIKQTQLLAREKSSGGTAKHRIGGWTRVKTRKESIWRRVR